MNNTSANKVSSIRSRFERNSTSSHQADLVRLASSSTSFKAFPRRLSTSCASKTRSFARPVKQHLADGNDSMSTMNMDASFSCRTADDSFTAVSGSSLSERMRSAWYMVEGDADSDEDE
eukprot:scaffold10520_cov144-Amphora_coffeaeformis.AAC.3